MMITATVPKTKSVTSQTGSSRYLTACLAASGPGARPQRLDSGRTWLILLAGQLVLATCRPRQC
jgi:hypothetical protein